MTTPAQPPAAPRDTSLVVDCRRCHLTVWACTTDRDGVCRRCRGLDLVTLVPAPAKEKR
jgi:hypothetical protein